MLKFCLRRYIYLCDPCLQILDSVGVQYVAAGCLLVTYNYTGTRLSDAYNKQTSARVHPDFMQYMRDMNDYATVCDVQVTPVVMLPLCLWAVGIVLRHMQLFANCSFAFATFCRGFSL